MDNAICFERTEKGHQELFNGQRTLRPRERQILFLVGEIACLSELKRKICTCPDFDQIIHNLLDNGFIRPVFTGQVPKTCGEMSNEMRMSISPSALAEARQHVLKTLAALVGTRSPLYTKIDATKDVDSFLEALAGGRKVLSAVASAHQAAQLEQEALARMCHGLTGTSLKIPDTGHEQDEPAACGLPTATHPEPVSYEASMEQRVYLARQYVLDTLAALVGNKSPIYGKVAQASQEQELSQALAAARKLVSAVASSHQAASMEARAQALLRGEA